ncbi:MAG: N-acetylmuramoyl-L-alanine amidase, partial [Coriobacteriia bacterium]|nr:N-acetylmuramoyl-L-alanine amidase [Coriobacteriia bacterium]
TNMTSSRSDRTQRDRGRRVRVFAVAAVILATVVAAVIAGAAFFASSDPPVTSETIRMAETTATDVPATLASAVETTASPDPMVEIPDVSGRAVKEARVVLAAVGLGCEIVVDPAASVSGSGDARRVVAQDPVPGQFLRPGACVTLRVPPEAGQQATPATGFVVCIDPGHQSSSDTGKEPVGPGSDEMKDRVLGGATGVASQVPEYEIALQISMNLKQVLESRGVTVVMTRTTNDVRISNAERAGVANKAGADLFVRVHGDGSTDPNAAGISTLYPASNAWTGPIADDSKKVALAVQSSVVAATGAVSRGVVARGDITGFNWSKVPAILVECGFLSNPVEDRLLGSPHYQDKLAQGMADGIMSYLETK